jgi:hypothetical protein
MRELIKYGAGAFRFLIAGVSRKLRAVFQRYAIEITTVAVLIGKPVILTM